MNSLGRKVCPLIQQALIAASGRIMPQRQNSSRKLQYEVLPALTQNTSKTKGRANKN